jgi:hypothetical protein
MKILLLFLFLFLFISSAQAETQYIGLGGGELGIGTTEFLSHYHGCSGVQTSPAATPGGTKIVLVKCSDRIFVGKLGGSPPSGAMPPSRNPVDGNPVIPPITTGPANDDPWKGTDTPNWWVTIRSDGSKVYVFDQMSSVLGTGRNYVPGCLNLQTPEPRNVGATCFTTFYEGTTVSGESEYFSFDGEKTLAIRFDGEPSSNKHAQISLAGPTGSSIPLQTKMWLTQDVHETYEAAKTRNTACATSMPAGSYLTILTNAAQPYGSPCVVVSGRYYLMMKTDVNCTSCRYSLSVESDLK